MYGVRPVADAVFAIFPKLPRRPSSDLSEWPGLQGRVSCPAHTWAPMLSIRRPQLHPALAWLRTGYRGARCSRGASPRCGRNERACRGAGAGVGSCVRQV